MKERRFPKVDIEVHSEQLDALEVALDDESRPFVALVIRVGDSKGTTVRIWLDPERLREGLGEFTVMDLRRVADELEKLLKP